MSGGSGASVADEWVQVACKDWRRAERNLKDRDSETAGFFLHQSLEQYLKAFLMKHNSKLEDRWVCGRSRISGRASRVGSPA